MTGDEVECFGFEVVTAVEMREDEDLAHVVHRDDRRQVGLANSFHRIHVVFVRNGENAQERLVRCVFGEST